MFIYTTLIEGVDRYSKQNYAVVLFIVPIKLFTLQPFILFKLNKEWKNNPIVFSPQGIGRTKFEETT